jgi:hypothetical protein
LSITWATRGPDAAEPVDAEVVAACASPLAGAPTYRELKLVVKLEDCKHRVEYIVNERHALMTAHATVDLKAASAGFTEVSVAQLLPKVVETVAEFRKG